MVTGVIRVLFTADVTDYADYADEERSKIVFFGFRNDFLFDQFPPYSQCARIGFDLKQTICNRARVALEMRESQQ